jgi:hypothetical protein
MQRRCLRNDCAVVDALAIVAMAAIAARFQRYPAFDHGTGNGLCLLKDPCLVYETESSQLSACSHARQPPMPGDDRDRVVAFRFAGREQRG